jgi:iron complex outermembrane recepter protein
MSMTNRLLLTLLASTAVLHTAQAQQTNPAAEQISGTVLEDIVVTARKREERLQDTPISVAAFSGEALEARGVATIADVGKFTPNMSFEAASNNTGQTNSVTMFIRGVGQTDWLLTIDPGVGLYIDGVYVSRSVGGLLDTVDVERVEVLRGPQGTLFGKNTIGGAVVMTSKAPGDEYAATVEAVTGRYERIDLRAAVDLPVAERFKLRAVGSMQQKDGYVRRLTDNVVVNDTDRYSGRLIAELEASEDLKLTFSLDGTKSNDRGTGSTMVGFTPNGFLADFYNFALNAPTCLPGSNGAVPNLPNCYSPQWITGDKQTTWSGAPNFSTLDLWGASLALDWDAGWMNFKSISAYRTFDAKYFYDVDAAPMLVIETGSETEQEQYSQEFQFSGSALDDRLKWLFGLFYMKEKGTDDNDVNFSVGSISSGGKVDNDSYAAFTQLTYTLVDNLNLTVGARYTYEKKRFTPDQFIINDLTGGGLLLLSRCNVRPTPIIPPNPALCTADPTLNPSGNLLLPRIEASTKAKEFTPAISIDYRFSPEFLAYASYSKGFKSGGFTQRVFPPEPAAPSFNPEFVESYEVGFKSDLLGNRLRLNGAAFYADYTDLQLIVIELIAPQVRNAGAARIQGFELEFQAVPHERIEINGGVGYTDAKYKNVPANAAPVTEVNKLPNAPKWTMSMGVGIDAWENEWAKIALRGDWSYRGSHFKDAVNTPVLNTGGVHLFDASLMFGSRDDKWSVSAGGTNLGNKKFLTSGYNEPGSGAITATYARGREWFLRGKISF